MLTQPAAHAGLAIEPALVETALDDARDEPGALPALACTSGDLAAASGPHLTLADYLAAGGVQGAVAQTAAMSTPGSAPPSGRSPEASSCG